MTQLNLWIAFAAGFASFISPCCLPLYPSYLSYITGISVNDLKNNRNFKEVRLRTTIHTLFFIAGFSIVFYSLGWGAGIIAEVFSNYRDLLRQLTAIMIFVMALFLLGIFQPQWLMKERKMKWNTRPAGYAGTLFIGIGFAAGWSPCVGPILGSIIGLAANEPGSWFGLMTAYSLGFAIPFFILSFFIGGARWLRRYSSLIMKVGGVVMLIMAILLYTDKMTQITIWLNVHTPEWLKF